MKKTFFEAIRAGRKTTTLRFWRHRRVRPGSTHNIRGLGRIRIDAVEETQADGLTDADAVADGLAGLAALRETLETLYPPPQRDGRRLYLVRFTYLGDSS